jgi:hypothetical protein
VGDVPLQVTKTSESDVAKVLGTHDVYASSTSDDPHVNGASQPPRAVGEALLALRVCRARSPASRCSDMTTTPQEPMADPDINPNADPDASPDTTNPVPDTETSPDSDTPDGQ